MDEMLTVRLKLLCQMFDIFARCRASCSMPPLVLHSLHAPACNLLRRPLKLFTLRPTHRSEADGFGTKPLAPVHAFFKAPSISTKLNGIQSAAAMVPEPRYICLLTASRRVRRNGSSPFRGSGRLGRLLVKERACYFKATLLDCQGLSRGSVSSWMMKP